MGDEVLRVADGDAGGEEGGGVAGSAGAAFLFFQALLVGAFAAQGKTFRFCRDVVEGARFGMVGQGVLGCVQVLLAVLGGDPRVGGAGSPAGLGGQVEGYVLGGGGGGDEPVEVHSQGRCPGAVPLVAASVAAVRAGQRIAVVALLQLEVLDAAAYQEEVPAGEGLKGEPVDARPGRPLDERGAGVVGGPQRAEPIGASDVAAFGYGPRSRVRQLGVSPR
ncbi:hypothetical protein [Streptomyces ipomoeae]|uniref:hypothetical protein n=1 Tax=Streptomyces ipomoeae TaxID=103232 RepID=UPI0015F0D915|nr:hypothetical protein [Streptomyces ipomoeae]